ncbi:MAG: glycine zipper 2TM domain-containing protein [Micavibrio sp.]|nr:glycine zipper 2TM domain-containing protein [Micavibrio sp.]
MKKFWMIPAAVAVLALPACEGMNQGNMKQTLGTGTGAVLGGVVGSSVGKGSGQLWATGAGVLLGALIGSEIGKSLDRADKTYLAQANQRAYEAPMGETIAWNNPQSGNYGTVTPVNQGQSSTGRYCREYEQTIYVGGRQETARGQACENADGTWEIIN